MKHAIVWVVWAFVIGFTTGEAVVMAFGYKVRAFMVSVLQKLTSKVSGQ